MPTVDDDHGGLVKAERKPGDFIRTVRKTPQVAHPTKRTKKGAPNLVQYGRPSGLGDGLTDSYNLVKWEQRGIVSGAALMGATYNDERLKRLAAAPDEEAANRTADALIATWKGAAGLKDSADVGTFIHAVVAGERLDMAEADRLGIRPEHIDVVRREWAAWIEASGFEVLAQELPVINDGYHVAGTCDLVLRKTAAGSVVPLGPTRVPVRDGDVVGGDIKTGKLTTDNDGVPSWWSSYPVQLAAYFCGSMIYDVDAHAADVEAGTYTWPDDANPYRTPWPWNLRQDVALIVHIDAAALLAGQTRELISLVPVDLEVGRKGAALAVACSEWAKLPGCGVAIGPAATKIAPPEQADPLPLADVEPAGVADMATAPATIPTPQEQHAAMRQGVPDEGADLNDDEFAAQWNALQAQAAKLKARSAGDYRRWLDWRTQAAHANVDYHSGGGKRTARRFEILRATLLLIGTGFDADAEAKNLVVSVTGDEAVLGPVITVGHAIGSLNAAEAAEFALLVDHAINGAVTCSFHATHTVYTAA